MLARLLIGRRCVGATRGEQQGLGGWGSEAWASHLRSVWLWREARPVSLVSSWVLSAQPWAGSSREVRPGPLGDSGAGAEKVLHTR